MKELARSFVEALRVQPGLLMILALNLIFIIVLFAYLEKMEARRSDLIKMTLTACLDGKGAPR